MRSASPQRKRSSLLHQQRTASTPAKIHLINRRSPWSATFLWWLGSTLCPHEFPHLLPAGFLLALVTTVKRHTGRKPMLCHRLPAHGTGKRHLPRADRARVVLFFPYQNFWLVVHNIMLALLPSNANIILWQSQSKFYSCPSWAITAVGER